MELNKYNYVNITIFEKFIILAVSTVVTVCNKFIKFGSFKATKRDPVF